MNTRNRLHEHLTGLGVELLLSGMFPSCSVDLFVDQARVAKGTFYQYYSSRQEYEASCLHALSARLSYDIHRLFEQGRRDPDRVTLRLLTYLSDTLAVYQREADRLIDRGHFPVDPEAVIDEYRAIGSRVTLGESTLDRVLRIASSIRVEDESSKQLLELLAAGLNAFIRTI